MTEQEFKSKANIHLLKIICVFIASFTASIWATSLGEYSDVFWLIAGISGLVAYGVGMGLWDMIVLRHDLNKSIKMSSWDAVNMYFNVFHKYRNLVSDKEQIEWRKRNDIVLKKAQDYFEKNPEVN